MPELSRRYERQGPLWLPRYKRVDRRYEEYLRKYRKRFAAITRVQVQSTTTNTGGSENLNITSTGLGNLLVVTAINLGASSLSITDNKSSVYTSISGSAFLGSDWVQTWYLANTPSGITQINITGGVSNNFYTIAVEYSGVATSSPLDQSTNWNNTGFGGAWASSPAVTTTQASELLLGVAASQSAGVSTMNFTNISGTVGYGSLFLQIGESIVSSIQTSITFNGTQSGSNTSAMIATFKAASAAAPPFGWNQQQFQPIDRTEVVGY